MTLKQLIGRYAWLNIEASLLQEYPHSRQSIFAYENVYHTLLLLPAADTDLLICIENYPTEWGTTAVEITGKKQTPHIADAQLSIPYCLHLTPWQEWLAMPVAAKCFQLFSETDIIAHCLYEMTRHGFDQQSIFATADNLCSIMDEMNDEAQNSPATDTLSWEEFLKQFNEKEK